MHLSRHSDAPNSPELLPGKGIKAFVEGLDDSSHILLPPLETEQGRVGIGRQTDRSPREGSDSPRVTAKI